MLPQQSGCSNVGLWFDPTVHLDGLYGATLGEPKLLYRPLSIALERIGETSVVEFLI